MQARVWNLFGDFAKGAFPRAIALFFGCFALLNLVIGIRSPGFDANLWWIDLRFMSMLPMRFSLGVVSLVLIAFAVVPATKQRWRQRVTAVVAVVIAMLAAFNAVQFYRQLAAGTFRSHFPIPLSLFVCLAFLLIFRAALRPPSSLPVSRQLAGIFVGLLICVFLFPVLQVLCFGKTDYRRPADVVVVLGARAYKNGEPSDALADRVRTAAELYNQGLVKKLLMSGGPGDGDIHETEAMRRYAVKLGVHTEDIYADEGGINTQATVTNTEPMFARLQARRILVVSHFYHLPRIKMAYHRDGWEVYTVPATEKYFLRETPYMVLREVAALWVYYLRPLRSVA